MVKFIDKQSGNPRRRLDLLLQSPGNSAHEGKTKFEMNKTLDLLYMSILREAFCDDDDGYNNNDNDDLQDGPMIRSVLGVVILAFDPPFSTHHCRILGLNMEDVWEVSHVPAR